RTARLLIALLLEQADYPKALITLENRAKYLDSLEKAQTKGNFGDYYQVIYEGIENTLDVLLSYVNTPNLDIVPSEFYNVLQVAHVLQVDPETVRRYVRSGKLKATKLGGR